MKYSRETFPVGHKVHEFMQYMADTWVHSNAHPPSTWCQFGLPIRTNNAVEGWHRAFHARMGLRPALYSFISKLAFDATSVNDRVAKGDFLVRENKDKIGKEKKIDELTEDVEARKIVMALYLDGVADILGYNEKAGKKANKKK